MKVWVTREGESDGRRFGEFQYLQDPVRQLGFLATHESSETVSFGGIGQQMIAIPVNITYLIKDRFQTTSNIIYIKIYR